MVFIIALIVSYLLGSIPMGLLLARPMPLRMGGLHEVTQATPWDELFIEAEPLPEAGPVLLEPIGNLMATVPGDVLGDIMGEVTKRRGRVLGMHPAEEGQQTLEAEVPVSEMHDFTTYLRQLTQGRGSFAFQFTRYEPLPANLEAKVVEDAKKFIEMKDDEE